MLTAPRRQARAALASAAARASRNPDDPAAREAVANASRDYYATALEDYIRKTVDSAPPLTPEQRARLSLLLSGGPDAAA